MYGIPVSIVLPQLPLWTLAVSMCLVYFNPTRNRELLLQPQLFHVLQKTLVGTIKGA